MTTMVTRQQAPECYQATTHTTTLTIGDLTICTAPTQRAPTTRDSGATPSQKYCTITVDHQNCYEIECWIGERKKTVCIKLGHNWGKQELWNNLPYHPSFVDERKVVF